MKAMMLINPKAGLLKGCETAGEIKKKLTGLDCDPEISVAKSSRGIESFIRKVKRDKPQLVLVAGGDGTISSVVKGLIDTPTTFGFIPTGSMNNIGQALGLSDQLHEAVEVINQGHVASMDVGKVNGEIFLESVGFGLVAEIMDRVGEQDSRKEVFRVARHTVAELVTTDTIPVKLKADDRDLDIETVWLTITNTGRAAAALVDPTSNMQDHLLELVYCEPIESSELAQYALAYLRNSHLREEKFHRMRAREISIVLPKTARVHVDGELRDWKKINVEVVPSAIKVLTP